MILEITGLSKSFGAKTVLSNLDLKIEDHDRIGLIGENGAGKSTLLNIIVGDMEYDEGTVVKGTGKRIGFLRQDSGLSLGGTIISEMRSVFGSVLKTEERMRSLEHRMAELEHSSDEYTELSAEYEHEKSSFEAADGYNVNVRINTVLTGMGFGSFDPETPVEQLSGGERTRLALAKLLLENPKLDGLLYSPYGMGCSKIRICLCLTSRQTILILRPSVGWRITFPHTRAQF